MKSCVILHPHLSPRVPAFVGPGLIRRPQAPGWTVADGCGQILWKVTLDSGGGETSGCSQALRVCCLLWVESPLCEVRTLSLLLRFLLDTKRVPTSPESSHPRKQHGRLFRIYLTSRLSSSSKIWVHVVMLVSLRSPFKNFNFLTPKTFCIGTQLISNVVVVSGEH